MEEGGFESFRSWLDFVVAMRVDSWVAWRKSHWRWGWRIKRLGRVAVCWGQELGIRMGNGVIQDGMCWAFLLPGLEVACQVILVVLGWGLRNTTWLEVLYTFPMQAGTKSCQFCFLGVSPFPHDHLFCAPHYLRTFSLLVSLLYTLLSYPSNQVSFIQNALLPDSFLAVSLSPLSLCSNVTSARPFLTDPFKIAVKHFCTFFF